MDLTEKIVNLGTDDLDAMMDAGEHWVIEVLCWEWTPVFIRLVEELYDDKALAERACVVVMRPDSMVVLLRKKELSAEEMCKRFGLEPVQLARADFVRLDHICQPPAKNVSMPTVNYAGTA